MKILNLYKNIITEEFTKRMEENNVEIDGDDIIGYHYSDKLITEFNPSKTSIKTPSGSQIGTYFYCHIDGISYDTGIPNDYRYTVKIPLKTVYDGDTDNLNVLKLSNTEAMSYIRKHGFTTMFTSSMMGKIGHQVMNPILISSVPVKPIKIERFTKYGYQNVNPDKISDTDSGMEPFNVGEYIKGDIKTTVFVPNTDSSNEKPYIILNGEKKILNGEDLLYIHLNHKNLPSKNLEYPIQVAKIRYNK